MRRRASGLGSELRRLAEEVVLFDGRQTGMRVGRADHAELVGVDAELALELEAVLQRRAGILELEHLRLLQLAQVEIALVPALEIGELVVRRQERMGLAIALDLRRLVEALPLARASRRIRGRSACR